MRKRLLVVFWLLILLFNSYLFFCFEKKLLINKQNNNGIAYNKLDLSEYFEYDSFSYNNRISKIENIDTSLWGISSDDIVINRTKKSNCYRILNKDFFMPKYYYDITIMQYESIDKVNDVLRKIDKNIIGIDGFDDTEKIGRYELNYIIKNDNVIIKEPFILNIISLAEKRGNNIEELGYSNNGYKIQRIDGLYYVNGLLIANKTYSLPSYYSPNGLLPELVNAFNVLQSAAASEGINIYIISGFRSYYSQRSIYNSYVAKDGVKEADTYSARPGFSEHQTGLAIDVNSLYKVFGNTREGIWLKDNCYKYGFIIRYVNGKDNITGYMYEPWHIRYVGKELAERLYNNGDWITVEEYFGITSFYN